jgi:site-specific recombinase XerD
MGKGRKERCTPLTKHAAAILSAWLRERADAPSAPLFPNARGKTLSRDGVAYILRKHDIQARKTCPSLGEKRVSPHVLRHTAAVHLLQAGVDITVIALWLGHEQCETTQAYLDADLAFKERILKKAMLSTDSPTGRYRPPDHLLSFLNGL